MSYSLCKSCLKNKTPFRISHFPPWLTKANMERSSVHRKGCINNLCGLFPAQEKWVCIINKVMCRAQVSLEQRAKQLQKWSCRSKVKGGKNVIFSAGGISHSKWYRVYLTFLTFVNRTVSSFTPKKSVSFCLKYRIGGRYIANDHITLNTPVLVRSLKLSRVELG